MTPTSANRPEYAEAAAWAEEAHGTLRASRRTAWIAAGGAGLAALLLAAALLSAGPLRSAVPYGVAVDDQAGYAQAVRGLEPGALTANAAVNESEVARYVMAREGFAAAGLPARYDAVALRSSPSVLTRYRLSLDRADPSSPLVAYAPGTTVTPVIRSVSLLEPGRALVRFETVRSQAGLALAEQRGWQAVVDFVHLDRPMRTRERFDNPLGFQVTTYTREPDGGLPTTVAALP